MPSRFDTVWPADSVEFCPDPEADIFVCGTYKLLDNEQTSDDASKTQNRVGQCLVYRWSTITEGSGNHSINADQIQRVNLPAILDMKWSHKHIASPPTLGIADSEGNISLYQWNRDDSRLNNLSSLQVAPSSNILCLSLDWSNRRFSSSETSRIVTSLSNGDVCVLDPEQISTLQTWHAHDFEPWIAAWNYWNTNIVYSGGDDLKLKGWDLRDVDNPTFTNKRFNGGVTTVQSHPYVEHLIAVGSYDSKVRLIDVRKPQVPLSETDVGGGVWRVKWHPNEARKNDLLVACMHDGFKVVQFGSDNFNDSGNILKRYDGHESLAYGVDWSYKQEWNGGSVVGSCSFYDHNLHLWWT